MNILIVDDNEENRYLLEILLKGNGYIVHSAENGEEALKLMELNNFNMIISDILMPVMDGFQLCRKIKSDNRFQSIIIIVYTATYTGAKDEEFALQLGANRFVQKPCEPDILLQIIQELFNESESTNNSNLSTSIQIEEEEILKLYNERLVRKLEQKMIQAENEIIARQKAEESLKLSNSRLNMALASSKTGLWDLNLQTNEMWFSKEWKEQLGYLDEEIPNRVGEWEKRIHPDEKERILNKVNNFISGQDNDYESEFRLLHKDGSYRWFVARGAIITENNVRRFLGSHVDITEKKNTENKLLSSLTELAVIHENAPVPLIIFDPEMKIQKVNKAAARLIGRDEKSIFRLSCGEGLGCIHSSKTLEGCGLSPECSSCQLRSIITQTFKDGKSRFDQEIFLPFISEETSIEKCLMVSSSFLKIDNKDRVLASLQDITETKRIEKNRKELEAQLYQAQKMESVGLLAGGVAHDFNNLLTVILNYSELLMLDIDKEHPIYSPLEAIGQAALRAAELTRQLLAFSRKQILDVKIIDLNNIIIGFEKLLRRLLREDIEVYFNLSEESLPIKADVAQIEQVLMNLAVNARDAMPDGGKLTVETFFSEVDKTFLEKKHGIYPGNYAMLSVNDSGCGMSKEIMEHIFEPFFTTKETGKGTGLGLATSYGIVKQHGGFIWVYSESCKGTTFKVYLPICDEKPQINIKPLKHQTNIASNNTIMIVEDDVNVLELINQILSKQGFKIVIKSSNTEESIIMAENFHDPINLLISDLIMPGLNGPDIFKKIYKYHPEIKVLFMSGYTQEVISTQIEDHVEFDFIQKPFTANGLIKKISDILSR